MRITDRVFYAVIALACIGLLGYGYYLEFFQDLLPCPMCIFQRLCYLAIVLVSVVGFAHAPKSSARFAYAGAIACFAAIGAAIAGRQTWLQHLPPELVPECGPGLEFMLEMYPLLETIERALKGTGDCAEVSWRFVGLSIAEWSLVCFCGLVVVSVWQLAKNRRAPHNPNAA